MIVTEREREREAETQAEGEAGSMHQEPDVGFDPGSPGSRPGPKAGSKLLRHPGIPLRRILRLCRSSTFHNLPLSNSTSETSSSLKNIVKCLVLIEFD